MGKTYNKRPKRVHQNTWLQKELALDWADEINYSDDSNELYEDMRDKESWEYRLLREYEQQGLSLFLRSSYVNMRSADVRRYIDDIINLPDKQRYRFIRNYLYEKIDRFHWEGGDVGDITGFMLALPAEEVKRLV